MPLGELTKFLPKVTQELLPKVEEPLMKMLQTLTKEGVNESITAVERAANKFQVRLAPEQRKLWMDIAPHIAAASRQKRLGMKPLDAFNDIWMQTMGEENQLARRGYAAVEAGQKAVKPEIPDLVLPADTKALDIQGAWKSVKAQLDKAKKRAVSGNPADIKAAEDLALDLQLIEKSQVGPMEYIRDMPWWAYWAPAGPKFKFEQVLLQDTPVLDKAVTDTYMANVWKSASGWWHGLTGKGGPGGGFKDWSKDAGFITDFKNLYEQVNPWLERYYGVMQKVRPLQKRLGDIKAKNPALEEAELLKIDDYKKASKALGKLLPQAKADLIEINRRFIPVAEKYYARPDGADVRIALYRDPAYRHLVEGIMPDAEKQVAQGHRDLMEAFRTKLEGKGINVLSADQEYVHHSLRYLMGGGKWRGLSTSEAEQVNKMASRISPFVRRNYGSLPLFPSIHGSTNGYIRTAARKLAMTDFRKKWLPMVEGKDAVMRHWPNLQKFTRKYVDQFNKNMWNDSWWEKMAHRGTMWLYASKVWGTASAPFKHMLKQVRILSTHPYDAIRTMPSAMRGGMQLALQRFGVKPGKEALFMRNVTASRNFFEAMSGIHGEGQWLDRFNTIGNLGIGAVETVERGWTAMIALSKAQRHGLSMNDAMRGLYSTILTNNFLGGADRMLWLQKSWQQFMAPFFYTPMRVTEETINMVLKSLPRRVVIGMKDEAMQLAWRFPKDAFGTPYAKHMLMFGGAVAGLESYARAHDTSLWSIVAAHFPGLRPRGSGYELGIPPAALLSDWKDRGGDFDAAASAIFDFLASTPALDKAVQIARDKQPFVYDKDWRRQLLALPSQKRIAEAQKRAEEKTATAGPHTMKFLAGSRRLESTALGGLWPRRYFKEKGKPPAWRLPVPLPWWLERR